MISCWANGREGEADPAGETKAMYFDNEGHVISYRVNLGPSKSIVFVSDSAMAGPRFRLTYTVVAADTLGIRFEIAPPGKPELFSPYITAQAYRVH